MTPRRKPVGGKAAVTRSARLKARSARIAQKTAKTKAKAAKQAAGGSPRKSLTNREISERLARLEKASSSVARKKKRNSAALEVGAVRAENRAARGRMSATKGKRRSTRRRAAK